MEREESREWPAALLTVEEVADLLQVSSTTIRRLVRHGDIRVVRIRRSVRVRPSELERFVVANELGRK
jgi:excisionase family DNA binding protein